MSNLPNQKFFTIGEVARQLGLSIETLRRWDRAGKINAGRTPGGQRVFTQEDVYLIREGLHSASNHTIQPQQTYTERVQSPEESSYENPISPPKPVPTGSLINAFIYLIFFVVVGSYLSNIPSSPQFKTLSQKVESAKVEISSAVSDIPIQAEVKDKAVLGVETVIAPLVAQEGPIANFLTSSTKLLSRIGDFFKPVLNFTNRLFALLFLDTKENQVASFSLPEGIKVEGDNIFLGASFEGTTTVNNNFNALATSTFSSNVQIQGSLNVEGPTTLSSLSTSTLTTTSSVSVGGNLTAEGTINGNTLTSTKLIFSGSSPSIYPSTTNSGISLNGNGTGAINIGNSGTGDVYIAGGSGDSGCTITNSSGSLNCSSNITSAGDLIANGGDILTDKTTLSLGSSSTTINIPGSLTVSGTATFSSDVSVTTGGQLTLSRIPTLVHTGTWAIGSATWNESDATIYVNPASATADSNIFALSVGGSVRFDVDAEGDVYANNLVLAGNTTTASTTVSGDLTVEGNTTLGDATTDTLTINTASLTWAGGNKTLDITGAATRTLTLLNSTAGQVADIDLSDGNLKVNGATIITNAGAGSFTTVGGTITTASQTNITAVGTLSSLSVTGNINSTSGGLQTNSITRIDNSGNLTAGTGAFSGTVTIGGGTGKITVGTIDPPYTINGEKYATYLSSMTGVNEETAGTIQIKNSKCKVQSLGEKVCEHEINFGDLEKGSDLWLFYQVTDFGKNWENLTAVLTPNFNGRVWYAKDSKKQKLTIYGNTIGEVSYHFISPRFDYLKWANTRTDGSEGFVLSEKK